MINQKKKCSKQKVKDPKKKSSLLWIKHFKGLWD